MGVQSQLFNPLEGLTYSKSGDVANVGFIDWTHMLSAQHIALHKRPLDRIARLRTFKKYGVCLRNFRELGVVVR